ncbi:hypothetical protein V8G54_009070 [Vigna mungo]|uniref:Uncharacterized protein n=1 Tax=Vigna mungo TaxID=3915 RepID=A0AAQ3NXB8_VIGMU
MEMTNMISKNNYEGLKDEKDKEMNQPFQIGRKRKKNEGNPTEIRLSVVNVMIEFEVAAQEDADLQKHGKPAINKFKKLSLFTDIDLEHHDRIEHLKNSGIGNAIMYLS